MKYSLLIILFLAGCAATGGNRDESAVIALKFDVDAGTYQMLQISEWHTGDTICQEVSIIEPRATTKWLPSTTLHFTNDDPDTGGNLRLQMRHSYSPALSLYLDVWGKETSEEEKNLIVSDITFGEQLRYYISFPKENLMKIRVKGIEKTLDLKFAPKKLFVSASSSVATIKMLRDRECEQNMQ